MYIYNMLQGLVAETAYTLHTLKVYVWIYVNNIYTCIICCRDWLQRQCLWWRRWTNPTLGLSIHQNSPWCVCLCLWRFPVCVCGRATHARTHARTHTHTHIHTHTHAHTYVHYSVCAYVYIYHSHVLLIQVHMWCLPLILVHIYTLHMQMIHDLMRV